MGLVDYSESESSGDETAPVAPKKAPQQQQQPGAKKPFQKVVDRSNPGKIVVSLPSSTTADDSSHTEEPPAKRARTGGGSGGAFSGFNSFLPAPKNANNKGSSGAISKPKPGVSLKTSAGPGFSRDGDGDEAGRGNGDDPPKSSGGGLGLNLPPPKRPAEPSIPEGQKAAEDVKLVGKPLMFKPLSVARNPNKKKNKTPKPVAAPNQGSTATTSTTSTNSAATAPPPPPPKKMSLFSMHTEEPSESSSRATAPNATYEPLFETDPSADDNTFDDYDYSNALQQQQAGHFAPSTGGGNSDSVDNVAADLNLSAAERRELFGRDGPGALQASKVINFNMDTEYRHNEELRASGQEQAHNPVRAIQGGGKHSLRQLVQNVRSQKDALEDSFAKGRSNRKEASSRYGW